MYFWSLELCSSKSLICSDNLLAIDCISGISESRRFLIIFWTLGLRGFLTIFVTFLHILAEPSLTCSYTFSLVPGTVCCPASQLIITTGYCQCNHSSCLKRI